MRGHGVLFEELYEQSCYILADFGCSYISTKKHLDTAWKKNEERPDEAFARFHSITMTILPWDLDLYQALNVQPERVWLYRKLL